MLGMLEKIANLFLEVTAFYSKIAESVYLFYFNQSRLILDYMHVFFKYSFNIFLVLTIVFTISYMVMGITLLVKKAKQKELKDTKKYPFVTIQIPTYNELAALNCATRCIEFDYPKDRYEIIIGDDSSKKDISARIDSFSRDNGIKVTRRGSNIGYKPGNLNHMLKYTKGEYIVIFDSDFLPEKDFLKRIMTPFMHDKDLSAVQARWITKNYSQNLVSLIGGTIPLLTHYLGLPFLNLVKGNAFIAGSAEAIKKSDLVELGGWKDGCLTEDIEYSLRLTSKGKKIMYLENLHCECEAPFTLKDLGKQQMRWAYGVISAIKIHFGSILLNRKLKFADKLNVFLLLAGYVVTFLFFCLTLIGMLSIITHRPEAINWAKFAYETMLNIILTSGFFATIILASILGGKTRNVPGIVVASFTVGLVVIHLVTLGIFKALFNRPIQWYMLTKKGNQI